MLFTSYNLYNGLESLLCNRCLRCISDKVQDCPACGTRIKKSLSTRTHVCKCGYVEDRDIAASINILKKGLNTVGHTGIYAWGETPSWAVGAILPSNGDSLNQESPSTAT